MTRIRSHNRVSRFHESSYFTPDAELQADRSASRHVLRSELQERAHRAIALLKYDRSIDPASALYRVVWGDPRKEDN